MPAQSKYNPQYHDDWAWSLAVKGATNEEIADAFHISLRTLQNWLNDPKKASLKDFLDERKGNSRFQS